MTTRDDLCTGYGGSSHPPSSDCMCPRVRTVPTLQHRWTDPVSVRELRFGNGPDLDGTFEGYLSVHGVTDSYGTRMLPGCWRAGGLDDDLYTLLFMHDPNSVGTVIGTFTAREDEKGLLISGRFAPTSAGQDARALAQMGAAPGLSVGFTALATLADDSDAFTACRLVEGSLIVARMASTPGALLSSVRQAVGGVTIENVTINEAAPKPSPVVVDLVAERQARRRQRAAAGLRLRSTGVEISTPPPAK